MVGPYLSSAPDIIVVIENFAIRPHAAFSPAREIFYHNPAFFREIIGSIGYLVCIVLM